MKKSALTLLLFALIIFSGCFGNELESQQNTETTSETVLPVTQTPIKSNPQENKPKEFEVPENFKEAKFDLRDLNVFVSIPDDWKQAGEGIYKKQFYGYISVIPRTHLKECAIDFVNCLNEELPFQNWTEFKLEHCDMQAATRLSYTKKNESQIELWVDFPEKNKGAFVVCTCMLKEPNREICTEIFSTFRC